MAVRTTRTAEQRAHDREMAEIRRAVRAKLDAAKKRGQLAGKKRAVAMEPLADLSDGSASGNPTGIVSASFKEELCDVYGCGQSVVPGTTSCGRHQADGDKTSSNVSGGNDGSLSDGTVMGGGDPANGYVDGTRAWTPDGELRVMRSDANTISVSGTAICYSPWTTIYGDPDGPFRERIMPDAIDSIINDGSERFLLLNHKWEHPLASTHAGNLTLRNTEYGLQMSADLDARNPTVQSLASGIEKGIVRGMSFSMVVPSDGERWNSNMTHRTVTRITRMSEVTITPIPAYPQTNITVLRALRRQEEMEQRMQLLDDEIEIYRTRTRLMETHAY